MDEIRDGDGWLLIDHDPLMGRTIWAKQEWDGNQVVTHYRTDYQVDKLIGENQEHRNASQNKRFGDWERVASIPLNTLYDSGLSEAAENDDQKFMSRWLNDPDNRAFRTFRGNV